MLVSSFNSVQASVDLRGVLIRGHLDVAGEQHGRAVMGLALDRVPIAGDAVAAVVVAIIAAEAERMATVYAEAGCSRRQVRAFIRAFYRGAAARNADAVALCAADPRGNA